MMRRICDLLALTIILAGLLLLSPGCSLRTTPGGPEEIPLLLVLQKQSTEDQKYYFYRLGYSLATMELRLSKTPQGKSDELIGFYQWDGKTEIRNTNKNRCMLALPDRSVYVSPGNSTSITLRTEIGTKTAEQTVDLKQSGAQVFSPVSPLLISGDSHKMLVLTQYFKPKPDDPNGRVCGLCLTELADGQIVSRAVDMNGECCVDYRIPAILTGSDMYVCLREGVGKVSLESLKLKRVTKFDELKSRALKTIYLPDPSQVDLVAISGASLGFWNDLLLISWGSGTKQFVWGLDRGSEEVRFEITIEGDKVTGPKNSVTIPGGYTFRNTLIPNR